jgi:NodT family efflux transporter outer membrane factor (OMF) lipoprotein
MPKLAPLVFTLGLLVGCASQPQLSAPIALRDVGQLPLETATQQATDMPTAQWPDTHWWTRLGDPQLDQLIDTALKQSPTLDAVDARTRNSHTHAALVNATRQPTLNASAQASGTQLPESLAGKERGGSFNVANIWMLNFTWKPDLWGMQRQQWQAAVGLAKATAIDAQAARLTLASNIAQTYVMLAQAYDARDLSNDDINRSQQLEQLYQKRIDTGIDNKIALHQQQSVTASARQQSAAMEQHIDALRNALAELTGNTPAHAATLSRPRLSTASLASPTVVSSDLLVRRPDLLAARWRVEAAQRQLDASNMAFYPSINLSAIAGLIAGGLGDLFSSKALLLNAGPAISLPIWDGQTRRQQVHAHSADYDLAVATYNQTLLHALRETVDALQALRQLSTRMTHLQQARMTAQQAHTRVEKRYQAGLATRIDVLNAQQPLLHLDTEISALLATQRSTSIQLYQALGGGLPLESFATVEHTP